MPSDDGPGNVSVAAEIDPGGMDAMSRYLSALAVILPALSAPALANDSIAGLGAGGIILGRTDAVAMESEDLFVSMDEVKVDYVFRNSTDRNVETVVAFPMPDIAASPYEMPALPDNASDNFLDFQITIDGKPVETTLEQRASAVGVDITEELKSRGVPVNPFTQPAFDALARLPRAVADDWIDRGVLIVDRYDDGSGMKDVRTPSWVLRSAYWWRTTFPAGQAVRVSHRYKPSVGASAGLSFYYDNGFQDPYPDYRARYCIEGEFERSVQMAAKAAPDGYPRLSEYRLQYVLKTGANWALGTIAKFHLTVDKGAPENVISLCGKGLHRTGPTRFELDEADYYPNKDIDILILKPYGDAERGDALKPAGRGKGDPDRKRMRRANGAPG